MASIPRNRGIGCADLVAAAVSALLMAGAFYPRFLFPLAWVGLVPLLRALRGKRRGECILLSLVFGVIFHAVLNFYIASAVFKAGEFLPYVPWQRIAVAGLAWSGAVGVCCVGPALFGLAYSWRLSSERTSEPSPAAVALLWTVLEYARSFGPLGYTWGDIGYTQTACIPVLQIASLVGVYGLSYLIAWVNAGIAELSCGPWRSGLFNLLAAGVTIIVLCLVANRIYGAWFEGHEWPEHRFVRIVQPGLSIVDKQWKSRNPGDICTEWQLSVAGRGHPQLVVWPETAVLEFLPWTARTRQAMASLAKKLKAWLIVGTVELDRAGNQYNCAVSLSPEGQKEGIYRKQHLVPFGEYVPLRGRWSFMEFFAFRERDFSPGHGMTLLPVANGLSGAVICFESMFPRIARMLTRKGAQTIIILTNDEWLAGTTAPTLHLAMAQMRAVENRRFVIRAANTGISAIISDKGRIMKQLGEGEVGIVEGKVRVNSSLSAYSRIGESWLILGFALWLILTSFRVHHDCKQDIRGIC